MMPHDEWVEITENVSESRDKTEVIEVPEIYMEKVDDPPCHWHREMHSHTVAPGNEKHEHPVPRE